MINTSALHDRPGSGMGIFGVKTWLSTFGTVSLMTQMITLMSVPSHLTGDVKEQLRMTCALGSPFSMLAYKSQLGDSVLKKAG